MFQYSKKYPKNMWQELDLRSIKSKGYMNNKLPFHNCNKIDKHSLLQQLSNQFMLF